MSQLAYEKFRSAHVLSVVLFVSPRRMKRGTPVKPVGRILYRAAPHHRRRRWGVIVEACSLVEACGITLRSAKHRTLVPVASGQGIEVFHAGEWIPLGGVE